jgi:hypothetical protein
MGDRQMADGALHGLKSLGDSVGSLDPSADPTPVCGLESVVNDLTTPDVGLARVRPAEMRETKAFTKPVSSSHASLGIRYSSLSQSSYSNVEKAQLISIDREQLLSPLGTGPNLTRGNCLAPYDRSHVCTFAIARLSMTGHENASASSPFIPCQ